MNSRILTIARNTFRKAVRDRVLYNLIAFALLMVGAAVLVGQISIGIERLVVLRKSTNAHSTPSFRGLCAAGSLSSANISDWQARWR